MVTKGIIYQALEQTGSGAGQVGKTNHKTWDKSIIHEENKSNHYLFPNLSTKIPMKGLKQAEIK